MRFSSYFKVCLFLGMTICLMVSCIVINAKDLQSTQPDSYEKDDSFEKAKPIEVNTSQDRTLHLSNDVDYIRLSTQLEVWYTIKLQAEGICADLYEVQTTNLVWSCTNTLEKELYGDNKEYFLKVYFVDQTKYKSTTYQLSYRAILPDSYETDNTEVEAKPLNVNETQKRTLHTTNDLDILYLDSVEGVWYTISLPSIDRLVVQVIDKETSQKIIDKTNVSSIPLVADGGTYYIKVFRAWNSTIRPIEYTISLIALALPDQYEPDNDFTTAKRIERDKLYSYTLHKTNDVDYMKVALVADSYCVIERQTTSPFMIVEVYTPSQTRILSITNKPFVDFAVPSTGDYYVKVFLQQNESSIKPTNYSLIVRSYTPDEHEPNDTLGNAKGLVPLLSYTASLHTPSDRDLYSFSSLPGVNHTFSFSYQGNGEIEVSILNSSGQVLKSAINPSTLSWETLSRESYYLQVKYKDPNKFSYTTYSFSMGRGTVSGIPVDEYEFDDTEAECKDHAIGGIFTHSLHWTNDVDYMRFSVNSDPNKWYRFDLSTSSLQVDVLQNGSTVRTINDKSYFSLSGSSSPYLFRVSFDPTKVRTPISYTIKGRYIAPDSFEGGGDVTNNNLSVPSTILGTIHHGNDKDFWKTPEELGVGIGMYKNVVVKLFGDSGLRVAVYEIGYWDGKFSLLGYVSSGESKVFKIYDYLFIAIESINSEAIGEYKVELATLMQ